MNRRHFLALPALATAPPAVRAADPVDLVVDAAKVVGKFRPLHGVNGGPLNQGGTLDLSAQFRDLAPPLARLHDCHWPNPDVVDIHTVFPDPKADPDKPESYDFARTDEYLIALIATGAGVVFRLGESIEHGKVKKYVHPPRDSARWAAACVGIVRHYTEGWANGFRHPIRYWEIWNEPDNRPAMWSGTDDDYFRLYAVAANAIKARFPKLLVGGPGLGNTGTLTGDRLDPAPFPRGFLAYCREKALPLDFFSWHCYTADPHELVRRAKAVRRMLDDVGFKAAESHLNEWNYLPGGKWDGMLAKDPTARQAWYERLGGTEGAAFTAAALLLLQDAPLDAANYFSAEPQGMGLFNSYGVPLKTFYAMKAARALADAGDRLAVRGDLPPGLSVAAAIDAKRTAVTLLLSRWAGEAGVARVKVKGAAWNRPTRAELTVVDAENNLRMVRSEVARADGQINLGINAPLVALIRFTPVE